jgi:fructose-1,6-bisphosphatase/inositol monophosphatase family enzyme
MKRLFGIVDAIERTVEEILKWEMIYWRKNDSSLVSNIDVGIQSSIIGIIKKLYQEDSIICEEGEKMYIKEKSVYSWVIDPIDGSDNFIHNKKEFGISIGLMKDNKFIEALLLFPKLKEKYYAAKGQGIWKNDRAFIPVETRDNCKEIILCSKTYKKLKPIFELKGYNVKFYNCATYSLLMLLKKEAFLYHTINTMIYDVGPMSFIIEEAGIGSFNKEKCSITFFNKPHSIPFFLSMPGDTIPDNIYHILISN